VSAFYLSAASKSSGKTTVSIGLAVAFKRRGLNVQTFKKGPDYIDPLWLKLSSGQPCFNLDFNVQDERQILETFASNRMDSDVVLVEGNKGLFDGLDLHGADSNAAMAKLLGLKVVLVIDVQGITRGVAPLLNGYRGFDADIEYAGVILNKVGGSRHEQKLRQVIDFYTDFEVLGSIPKNTDITISERHLGLTTDKEVAEKEGFLSQAGDVIENNVDTDRLLELTQPIPVQVKNHLQNSTTAVSPQINEISGLKIGIARDSAFCFYYEDDFSAFRIRGIELIFFDTLHDARLPDVDALFIGGGFPETHCAQLEENNSMRNAIGNFIESGKPVYAECGGLMYLSRNISWKGETHNMVGAIGADVEVTEKPVGRGYVKLKPTARHPWGVNAKTDGFRLNTIINAHEFHYSKLNNVDPSLSYGYDVERGWGVNGAGDGLIVGNVFASYSHLRNTSDTPWVDAYLSWVNELTNERI
jgi:cobyrinic acid a,c-diamide synthase